MNGNLNTKTPAAPADVLVAILDELKRIRAAIEAQSAVSRCSVQDAAVLSKLLPAAGGKFGSTAFRTKELFEDPAICELIPLSPSKIGTLLSRAAAERSVHAGYVVSAIGKDHGAQLWVVKRVSD